MILVKLLLKNKYNFWVKNYFGIQVRTILDKIRYLLVNAIKDVKLNFEKTSLQFLTWISLQIKREKWLNEVKLSEFQRFQFFFNWSFETKKLQWIWKVVWNDCREMCSMLSLYNITRWQFWFKLGRNDVSGFKSSLLLKI